MRIAQLAQQAGTTNKTLRFYESAGLLPEPVRTAAGYRDDDERVLERLRFVRAAQSTPRMGGWPSSGSSTSRLPTEPRRGVRATSRSGGCGGSG